MSFIIRGNILKNTCHFGLNKLTNAPNINKSITIIKVNSNSIIIKKN